MDFTLYTNCLIFFMALTFISCVESGGKEGLIFDRFTNSLIRLPNEVSKEDRCGAWAIACPAALPDGEKLMKNALIVKKIYDKNSKAAEVNIKACEEAYKLTLTYDFVKTNFRFGFAIYHIEYFHRSNYQRYKTLEESVQLMEKNSYYKGKYIGRNLSARMRDTKKTIPDYKDELWVNNDRRMEFTWITLFSLRWDYFNKILMKIDYNIDSNNKWPAGERCEDYSLGFEVYKETDVEYVDNLYSKDNQNKIFENIKIPGKKCNPISGQCPIPTQCDLNKICLSKWLLIPMDQFTFSSSTSSSICSNLATIPIWTDAVENVLKKVDQYLYTLHRVIGEPLRIISGVTEDVLMLPTLTKTWWKIPSKIYLDPVKQKIPVPQIIFKFIDYKFGSDLYSAVIVIHNSPDYNGPRICSEDITQKGGWEEITKDSNGVDFGNVYVCKYDNYIVKKLVKLKITGKPAQSLELNLLSFPSMTDDKSTRNIKEYVNEEFKTFSLNGADQNPRHGILQRSETFMTYEGGEGDGEQVLV